MAYASCTTAPTCQGEAVRGLIDNAVRQLGRIDILVNNAGIQHTAPIEDFPVGTPSSR